MGRWIFLLSIAVSLSGCCAFGGGCGDGLSVHALAWNGPGPNDPYRSPKRATRIVRSKQTITVATPVEPSKKEAELAALPKHSPEWWSLHDAIEAEADAKLAKTLIICRGCLPLDEDDRTGSIK